MMKGVVFLLCIIGVVFAQQHTYACDSTQNFGACYNYRYAPGTTPNTDLQSFFLARSGLIATQYPFAGVAGSRCRGDCPGFTSLQDIQNYDPASGSSFNAAAGAFVWAYRGVGVVCDRDGTSGFNDPATDVAQTTVCTAAGQPSASTDCVLLAATALGANWNPVVTNTSFRPNVASVELSEATGIYGQKCYMRRGGASAPQSPSDSTVSLGNFNMKCDISISRIAESRTYGVLTGNVWTLANTLVNTGSIQSCPVANRRVALQLWFFGGAIATTVNTNANTASLVVGAAATVKWNTAITCDYKGGATGVAGQAIASVRVYAAASTSGLPNGSPAAATVGRINFQFSCPAQNNGNDLDKIFWDPEFEMDESKLGAASSLSVSLLLLASALIVAIGLL